MLSWSAGARESDGVWARHWYHEVEKSTGFEPYKEQVVDISRQLRKVAFDAHDSYLQLFEKRLQIPN